MTGKSAWRSSAPRFDEQVEGLVDRLDRVGVLAVDLVDDDDGLVAHLQRLAQDEAGLRHGAFGGVHQQQHAVDHVHDALDLPAEIGVAGGVDDVDLALAAVGDGGVLGQDGDAALALQVLRVHDALGHLLVVAEDLGLTQQAVDERRLAVVDVGHDGDVADVLACFLHLGQPRVKRRPACEGRAGSSGAAFLPHHTRKGRRCWDRELGYPDEPPLGSSSTLR